MPTSVNGRDSMATMIEDPAVPARSHMVPPPNPRTHTSGHLGQKQDSGHSEYVANEKKDKVDASSVDEVVEKGGVGVGAAAGSVPSLTNAEAKLNNPLADYNYDELVEMGRKFAVENELADLTEMQRTVHSKRGIGRFGLGKKKKLAELNQGKDAAVGGKQAIDMVNASDSERKKHGETLWGKAALIAQNPLAFEGLEGLTEDDRKVLRHEQTHKWSQPSTLYGMVIMCSVAAAVQGMDETVINGAQLFFPTQFGIGSGQGRDTWLVGLVNSAPYLCCAILGCWMTSPLNHYFGRRGAIFITAIISFLTCIWSAVTNTWWHLFIARFVLGLGIGPKSATVPMYAAECSPAPIRGALVMMWQMFTAFGIMLGYVADLAFYRVPDTANITGLSWRLMLGSAGFPALIVMVQVLGCPESPRWLMSKGRYAEAYESMYRLRGNELLAARDIFYIHVLLQEEAALIQTRNRALELFTIPRVRRATIASSIVMFGQQFCGVNVIAYYSSSIFVEAKLSETSALLASFGFGLINWLFAIPAVYTIDTFGRRNLLLVTFPLMSIFLLMTGFSFWIPAGTARTAVVALGIYLFAIVYSPGEGPVPFVYSAEAFPITHRELGMSLATAVCWFFNFVLSITFPSLLVAFKPQGAFGWYAAWCIILWFLILLFVPETKSLTLEELDMVFSVPTEKHAKYQLRQLPRMFGMRRGQPKEELYHFDDEKNRATFVDKREVQHIERGEKQV